MCFYAFPYVHSEWLFVNLLIKGYKRNVDKILHFEMFMSIRKVIKREKTKGSILDNSNHWYLIYILVYLKYITHIMYLSYNNMKMMSVHRHVFYNIIQRIEF